MGNKETEAQGLPVCEKERQVLRVEMSGWRPPRFSKYWELWNQKNDGLTGVFEKDCCVAERRESRRERSRDPRPIGEPCVVLQREREGGMCRN